MDGFLTQPLQAADLPSHFVINAKQSAHSPAPGIFKPLHFMTEYFPSG